MRWQTVRKWLRPGLGIKRWLALLIFGITVIALAFAQIVVELYRNEQLPELIYFASLRFLPVPIRIIIGVALGMGAIAVAILELNRSILAPFSRQRRGALIDMMYDHTFGQRGSKLVAIGGGTGLPSVLRGMKHVTTNITAIVTVADDGGSSGRLRREMGVLPPGDLRNNIAALANDEDMMTQLFQYRFGEGGLEGHSFGNLFLTALSNITGSMDRALIEAGRVLAIQGRVLPSTLENITLIAEVRNGSSLKRVEGESQIPHADGRIERVFISPAVVRAFPEAIRALLTAELIVIGPGSLYTSIIPNLLVEGIAQAIRASSALCIYVCNIATQEGETDGFTVADHILAIERHAGRRLFQFVLANNAYPDTTGTRTQYVQPAPPDHEVRQDYEIIETDLTDPRYPWRHSPEKLSRAIELVRLQRQPGIAPAAAG